MMRLALLIVPIVACSYPPLDDDGVVDAPPGSECMAPASYGSPAATGQMAGFYPMTTTQPEALIHMGQISTGSPADYLTIGLFANTSQIPAAQITAPATFSLGAPDLKSCGACVVLYVRCSNCYSSSRTFAATYMASQGTLQIDSVATNLVGKLTNAKLARVNIASDGTTMVADSCTTQISSVGFNVVIQDY
jgi:hypothetical protein